MYGVSTGSPTQRYILRRRAIILRDNNPRFLHTGSIGKQLKVVKRSHVEVYFDPHVIPVVVVGVLRSRSSPTPLDLSERHPPAPVFEENTVMGTEYMQQRKRRAGSV